MEELVKKIQQGNQRALARAITMIENDHPEKLKLMDLINRSEKVTLYRDYRFTGCWKKLFGRSFPHLATPEGFHCRGHRCRSDESI